MSSLSALLTGRGAHVEITNVLEALDLNSLTRRPQGAPHSIYEELWHAAFWQDLVLAWIDGDDVPAPDHAADSWPESNGPVAADDAEASIQRFSQGIERARQVASDPSRLDLIVRKSRTARDLLESLLAHNAYHVGRMVLLRQLLGLWPPPSGGDTW